MKRTKADTVAVDAGVCTHVPKSSSWSSTRVRSAYLRGKNAAAASPLSRNARKKRKKIATILDLCDVPPSIKKVSDEVIKSEYVVVDGGKRLSTLSDTTSLAKLNKSVKVLSIHDLYVPIPNPQKGLCYRAHSNSLAKWVLCPREATLRATHLFKYPKKVRLLWDSFMALERVHRISTRRGGDKPVFGEAKYVGCCGKQPNRIGKGVIKSSHFDKVSQKHVKIFYKYMTNIENLFNEFSDPEAANMVREAKKLVDWSTLGTCKIFSAIAFGRNIYLPAHSDDDFTYSVVSVHKRLDVYTCADEVIAYFCFPRLGVAVPLKPGDAIIFNPREPHCVSSRCNWEDDVLCVSVYLKSAIVGGHNNSLPLSSSQKEVLANASK